MLKEMVVKKKFFIVFLPVFFASLAAAYAHCPLCTIGAVALASGATWLGVQKIVVGVFIGAFAVSTGWWFSNLIKKKYVPFQKAAIILFSFAATVLPIAHLINDIYPVYISLFGSYGTLLNRTYTVNLFVIGAIIGGIIVSAAPLLSREITKYRHGKKIPYQGIALTFVLLILAGIVLQIAR